MVTCGSAGKLKTVQKARLNFVYLQKDHRSVQLQRHDSVLPRARNFARADDRKDAIGPYPLQRCGIAGRYLSATRQECALRPTESKVVSTCSPGNATKDCRSGEVKLTARMAAR